MPADRLLFRTSMYVDSTREYEALISEVSANPRHKPYRHIHKALRRLLVQALVDAGKADPCVIEGRASLISAIGLVLDVFETHIDHENRYFHEPLRRKTIRATLPFDDDHRNQLQAAASLRVLLEELRNANEDAQSLAYRIYLSFGEFVAENLQHMTEEETVLTRAIWKHMSDDEILDMERDLRINLTIEQTQSMLRWMAASLNPQELAAVLDDARRIASPSEFSEVLELVCEQIGSQNLADLLKATKPGD